MENYKTKLSCFHVPIERETHTNVNIDREALQVATNPLNLPIVM